MLVARMKPLLLKLHSQKGFASEVLVHAPNGSSFPFDS